MKDMNEKITLAAKVKMTAAEIASDALIRHAERGTRNSVLFAISEPHFPIELVKEDTE